MRQVIVLIFLLSPVNLFSQDRNYTIDTIQVISDILQESRSIIIYKPLNISITDSVKFIYLIDGEYSNYRLQRINERFRDSILNIIAVGIVNTDRRRDLLYAKSADKFLDFITSELIPTVEKDYITKNRTLYGHSFGGGFTVYAMINKPYFFNCYIASSPTPIMDLIEKEYFLKIDSLSKKKIVFYFSFGSNDMTQVRKWSKKMEDNLSELGFNNFDWRFMIFEGKDHDNSDIPSLINGIRYLK